MMVEGSPLNKTIYIIPSNAQGILQKEYESQKKGRKAVKYHPLDTTHPL